MNDNLQTVYILGAGSTISHSKNVFPDINKIFQKALELKITIQKDKNINPDFHELDEYLKLLFNYSLLDTEKSLDFEKVFTFIDIELEKDQVMFGRLRSQLLEILITTFVKLKDNTQSSDETDYKRFSKILKPEDTMITFNWDFLLDDVLGRIFWLNSYPEHSTQSFGEKENKDSGSDGKNIQYEDFIKCRLSKAGRYDKPNKPLGFRYGYFLKLHGSVDWKICRNQFCEKFYDPIPTLYPLKNRICDYCLESSDTLIIPPTLQKSINQIPFIRSQWNFASYALSRANRLVIWGYSLPATDFYAEWLLRRALYNKNLNEVVVINPTGDHIKKIEEILRKEIQPYKSFIDYFDKINSATQF